MENNELEKRIYRIKQEMIRLLNALHTFEITDVISKTYNSNSLDVALRAEHIACTMRGIVLDSSSVSKLEFMHDVIEEHQIKIEQINEGLKIEFPCLLPKKKQHKTTKFITDPLFYAFSQYTAQHKIELYKQYVVCFVHCYNKRLPERRIRDYDNIEVKQVLDVITAFFMEDDTGKNCDIFHTTWIGEKDCTQVYIMQKEYFPQWLVSQKPGLLLG